MNLYFLLPITIGFIVVTQGNLNRWIGQEKGLIVAVFINAVVFFLLSFLVFYFVKKHPDLFPEFLQFKTPPVEILQNKAPIDPSAPFSPSAPSSPSAPFNPFAPFGPFNFLKVPLWYLIPGLCGFLLVLGLPYAIHVLGSARSFLLFIGSQIFFGTLWDFIGGNTPFSFTKLVGALLCLLGAFISLI